MSETVRFSDRIDLRCAPEFKALVERAAQRRGCKPVEWARQALMAALRAEGFSPEQDQQYCLVSNSTGEILVGPTYRPDLSDNSRDAIWLPVVNEDSEPFDRAKHWRVPPFPLRVESERVVRLHSVVLKTLEHA